MKTATIILLVLTGAFASPAKTELQRAEAVGSDQNWSRGNFFLNPEFDEMAVSKFEEPQLLLKWAIISGNLGEAVDRIRVRVRFNDERWIDLYAAKNSLGSFDGNAVRLRVFDSDGPSSELPDLRIVDWNHERLLVRFTPKSGTSSYHRFDLSESSSY